MQLTNIDGPMSTVRPSGLQTLLIMSPQQEWRDPTKPILQMVTPYVFVSDDPVYVNQFPPFLHYNKHRWPGVQICGRFPIDVWPRVHMWALESYMKQITDVTNFVNQSFQLFSTARERRPETLLVEKKR